MAVILYSGLPGTSGFKGAVRPELVGTCVFFPAPLPCVLVEDTSVFVLWLCYERKCCERYDGAGRILYLGWRNPKIGPNSVFVLLYLLRHCFVFRFV